MAREADRICKEYRVTLPGGFSLPIALAVETISHYSTAPRMLPSQEEMLTDFAEQYVCSQMAAGRILEKSGMIIRQDSVWILEGNYVCHEMIGREKPEQIGEDHG